VAFLNCAEALFKEEMGFPPGEEHFFFFVFFLEESLGKEWEKRRKKPRDTFSPGLY